MSESLAVDKVRKQLDSLKVVRDEIRVRLHLAGLDARAEWDKLERRLDKIELESQRAAVSAADSLIVSVEGLAESMREFKSRVEKKLH